MGACRAPPDLQKPGFNIKKFKFSSDSCVGGVNFYPPVSSMSMKSVCLQYALVNCNLMEKAGLLTLHNRLLITGVFVGLVENSVSGVYVRIE